MTSTIYAWQERSNTHICVLLCQCASTYHPSAASGQSVSTHTRSWRRDRMPWSQLPWSDHTFQTRFCQQKRQWKHYKHSPRRDVFSAHNEPASSFHKKTEYSVHLHSRQKSRHSRCFENWPASSNLPSEQVNCKVSLKLSPRTASRNNLQESSNVKVFAQVEEKTL